MKQDCSQPNPTHGGSRKGAGRPRLLPGARKRSLYVTDIELAAIKVLLKKLRGKQK